MDMKQLTLAQLAELEAKGRISLEPHICGQGIAQLAAYNYGMPEGDIDYRVACYGCCIETFAGEAPQDAYNMWQAHLILTGASKREATDE